jgi:(2Fe-2S) ferredoxin
MTEKQCAQICLQHCQILPFLLHYADGLFGVKLLYLGAKSIKK